MTTPAKARSRGSRAAQRALEILDFRTFVVAGLVLILLIVGYLVYGAVESRRDADQRARDALAALEAAAAQGIDIRQAQSRRIDLLEEQVIENSRVVGEQSQTIAALLAQLRMAGVEPVTTGPQDSNGDGDTDLGSTTPVPPPAPSTSSAPAPQQRQTTAPRPPRSNAPPARPRPRTSARPTPRPSPRPSPTPLQCTVPLVRLPGC